MGNNAANVTAGKPKIGGAIYTAPLGTNLPTSTSDELAEAFSCLGYVSDAGVTNDNSPSSQVVKAWGGDTVLNIQTERPDSFKLTLLETMLADVKKVIYGDENVSEDGDEIITKVTAEELPGKSYVIDMALKDGAKQRIVIPEGRISALDTITYADNAAVGYGITINDIPDESGAYHYEYLKKAEEVSG